MAKKYILVNDAGTTGNKAVIVDDELNIVASEGGDYETYYPHLNWATQRISEVYDVVVKNTKGVIEKSKIDPKDIAAVSFSNQMMTMIPVDKQGNALIDEVGIWCDMRQGEQAERLMKSLGGNDEYYKITGVGWQPELAPICKIMWYIDNIPEIYNKTFKFLQYKELVAYRWTGKFATEYGDMSMNGMMDSAKREISPEIFKAAHVDASKIPDILNSHDIVGHITKEAATVTGLAEGTPVMLGSGDVICANTGAGVIKEGMAYTYIGSANWSGVFRDKPSLDPKYKMNCNTMQPQGGYELVMITAAGGIAQDWFKDGFYATDEAIMNNILHSNIYDKMEVDTASVSPGADGLIFLPYLRGGGAPHFDINARASFLGLGMTHNRAHMLRALYEGICFNMRWLYDLYEELNAPIFSLDQIRAIGGGVLSDLWMQIYADVNGIKFARLSSPQQMTAIGAAIMGGVGAGIWGSYEEATNLIKVEKTFDPNLNKTEIYNDLYPIYKSAYSSLEALYHSLGEYGKKHVK
ncbi:MAG: FGGY-family carbohydrate kinase [Deltaproteobacteria bacterium]|nr:FGGY-family carbohydrate kinase [Deltaproteobacteria bacterium]